MTDGANCQDGDVASVAGCRWRTGWRVGVGLVACLLAAGCGGPSKAEKERSAVARLAAMVPTPEQLGSGFASMSDDEDTGVKTALVVASESADPDATPDSVRTSGWRNGYRRSYALPDGAGPVADDEPLNMIADVDDFGDAAAADAFIAKETASSLDLAGTTAGGVRILAARRVSAPRDAVVESRLDSDGTKIYVTSAYRRERGIVLSAVVGSVRRYPVSRLTRINDGFAKQVAGVLDGTIPPLTGPIPDGPELDDDDRAVADRLAEMNLRQEDVYASTDAEDKSLPPIAGLVGHSRLFTFGRGDPNHLVAVRVELFDDDDAAELFRDQLSLTNSADIERALVEQVSANGVQARVLRTEPFVAVGHPEIVAGARALVEIESQTAEMVIVYVVEQRVLGIVVVGKQGGVLDGEVFPLTEALAGRIRGVLG